jgi:starch synthase
MRVAHVVSEVYPFSKTGGLADVADALSASLARSGVETLVFAPFYRQTREWFERHGVRTEEQVFPEPLWIGDERHPLVLRLFEEDGRHWVFVVDDTFYDRDSLYADAKGHDYEDSVGRFSLLCRAALEYCLTLGGPPDLFHVHDWQASLVSVYLKTTYRRPGLDGVPSILTIHNLGYQGLFPAQHIYATGLDWGLFHPEGLEFYGQLNLLKGGIVFADAVTTVSPNYAEEIQGQALGCGLDGVLRAHRHKLTGILNGIDTKRWNPATDTYLPARYDAGDLSGKTICKRELQSRVGLPRDERVFLVGAVGRLTAQKGFPVLAAAFPRVADLPLQLVVLGTGDPALEKLARKLARSAPAKVVCVVGFDDPLAHLIEAGADAFVMPSAYEPCGLNQMYSQRYGTVPIAHATGGLKDTVVDATAASLVSGDASGFTFSPLTVRTLADAIRRAEGFYSRQPAVWQQLASRIMKLDRSWSASAQAYLKLYEGLLSRVP